jgi:hypothetical protein
MICPVRTGNAIAGFMSSPRLPHRRAAAAEELGLDSEMAIQINTFLDLVLRSGLLSSSEMCDACVGFDTLQTNENALSDLCKHLIDKRALTEWQCDKLRQGKYKGFFYDGYRLLSRLGMGETFSTYLGQQVSTGKLVEIDVTPPTIVPLKDGKFHYIVREITEEPQGNNE